MRRTIVGVMGSGSDRHEDKALELGAAIADAGFHLLEGGSQGAMAAVAEGFCRVDNREGLLVGIIPGEVKGGTYTPKSGYPNHCIELPIFTHLPGHKSDFSDSRNHLNVLSSDVIVVLPGGKGTLSELKMALDYGKPVIPFLSDPAELNGFDTLALNAVSDIDAVMFQLFDTVEEQRWAMLSAHADKAFSFWEQHLAFRKADGTTPLDAACRNRLKCIIRAVSWVESKHGSAGANHPARDPMQCGHPDDAFWKTLTGQNGNGDHIIGGPGAPNYWLGQMKDQVTEVAGFPADANPNNLTNILIGHRDHRFNPCLSFVWGVLYLLHRISGSPTYRIADCSRTALVDGAVRYNGGGDPAYRTKIESALRLTGCM